MEWEKLTSDAFEKAAEETGVCVIPMGVVEKHGSHLPLETDMIIGRTIAKMAAEKESFVIFPYYFWGQVNEARHTPGTIAVSAELQMQLLMDTVSEIRRNGFRKIVLLESHGGNTAFLNYFLQSQLYEKKDYAVYKIGLAGIFTKWMETYPSPGVDGHAGKTETELVMAYQDELVHMDKCNPEGTKNLHRLEHLTGIATPVDWYANFPTHQKGDPKDADPMTGRKKYELAADYVADCIRRIKEDHVAAGLMNEFFSKW